MAFALHRMQGRPSLRGPTMLAWAWSLVATLPEPVAQVTLRRFTASVGCTWLLRPGAQPRGGGAALDAVASHEARVRPRVALAITLVARCGMRLRDATRIAAGWTSASELTETALVVYPLTEKSDMGGFRVTEPVALPIAGTRDFAHRLALAWLALPPLSSAAEGKALLALTGSCIRDAGITDVRAPRRALAERTAKGSGRAGAASLLRHAANSAATARYTTTRDAIPRLLAVNPGL